MSESLVSQFFRDKRKPTETQWVFFFLAERTRFELVVGLLLRQFSKLVVSATHPPLQNVLLSFDECKVMCFGWIVQVFCRFF